jgi:hypothetical protein
MIALLSCLMWVAGIDVFAQSALPSGRDSLSVRPAPMARARRNRESNRVAEADSLREHRLPAIDDTTHLLAPDTAGIAALADSIAAENRKKIKEMEEHVTPTVAVAADSVPPVQPIDKKVWMPNPTKATWLAVVFPGAGQIYNRKFWKLPIIYGGFAGCAYALSWNGKMYKDYSQAYLDIMDSDPNTDSYLDLFPNRVNSYSESQLQSIIKKRKDTFRRYRDMSIFATIAVYLISIVDAYVDAELSNFDISPDLSMSIEPAVINSNSATGTRSRSVGLGCCFRF